MSDSPQPSDETTAGASGEQLVWTDGVGVTWTITAHPDALVLQRDGERHEFDRAAWSTALNFAPTGSKVVLRFDTGLREIGFLVSREEAHRLFSALGRKPEEPSTPHAEVEAVEPATATDRGPLWPKMRALPVAALLASCLSFLPMAGWLFGVTALILAGMALRRSQPNAADSHVRTMARLSIAFTLVGSVVFGLATYGMLQSYGERDLLDRLFTYDAEWSTGAIIAALVMVLISLSVHEAAHAITAWWCGDRFARDLGRVTLNPLAHIDPFGTIVLPLLLTYVGMPVFGYARPVPVQLGHVPRYRRAHILISAAGPVSNLIQGAICLALLLLLGSLLRLLAPGAEVSNFSSIQPIVEITGVPGGKALAGLALMLKLGYQINLMLAFFNLLPVPPLDGSWIAEHLAPPSIGRIFAAIRPYGFLVFLALLYTRALNYLLEPAYLVMAAGHILVGWVTGY